MTEPEQPERVETRGRRSLLNDQRQQLIVDAVRAGNYLKVAAAYAGVSERTLTLWLQRGRAAEAVEQAQGEDAVDDRERPYLLFLREVMRAEPAAEVAAITAWRSAFGTDWRAARDYLARKRPERWAGTVRVQMSQEEAERRIDAALDEAVAALDDDPDALAGLDDADLADALRAATGDDGQSDG